MAFERLKDKETFKQAYLDMLDKTYSKPAAECTDWERYEALVYLINKDADEVRTATKKRQVANREKRVYYFSMEFLIGKLLDNYLIQTGTKDCVREGLADLGTLTQKLGRKRADVVCRCDYEYGLCFFLHPGEEGAENSGRCARVAAALKT